MLGIRLAALAPAALALAACHPRAAAPAAPGTPVKTADSTREPQKLPPGPNTVVVTLANGVATPILEGPFTVQTINPGSDLSLGFSPFHVCADASIVWFAYSGGGVAVGADQTLCARSSREEPHTHGFSGHD